jgi:hypothetical protein
LFRGLWFLLFSLLLALFRHDASKGRLARLEEVQLQKTGDKDLAAGAYSSFNTQHNLTQSGRWSFRSRDGGMAAKRLRVDIEPRILIIRARSS